MRYRDEERGLYFEIRDGKAAVAEAVHSITSVEIPERFEDMPVTEVSKKAFLGCKMLRSARLPDSINAVGEWGFARCDSLEEVILPPHPVIFGRGAFEKDFALSRVEVRGRGEDTARLMAGAVRTMEAEYMLRCDIAGSAEWLLRWDQKLMDILARKDDEGYHLYVLCGEEDLHFDYDQYLEYNRRKKAGLSILRLLFDRDLSPSLRSELEAYIREHTVGKSSAAAWDHVAKEHASDLEYFELLVSLDAINRCNLELALESLGSRHAEAKAFLLNRFSEGTESGDYFDQMLL